MSESQMPEKPSGCGCGKANVVSNMTYAQKTSLNEKQQQLLARIKKVNQNKNSIYKTKTRVFM